MPHSKRDPLKELQVAARVAAEHVAPGKRVTRVVVYRGERELIVLPIIPCACSAGDTVADGGTAGSTAEMPALAPGWVVTERVALFDGKPVAVAGSRLKLLRVLMGAEHPLTAKELTGLAFDRHTDEANTRYHIRELRRELKAAFSDFEGELIVGENEGYRLVIR